MSKAKFWQMIGRGTRLCTGLLDGSDKDKFYIFDLCGNFEFFRMNQGKASANQVALQSAIFYLKTQIVYKLQDLDYQTIELIAFRKTLVEEMLGKIQALERDNFAVKQHLWFVEKFSDPDSYLALSYEDTLHWKEKVAPLLLPDDDVASKDVRYDTNFTDDILSVEWNESDLENDDLKEALWSEVGSRQDYEVWKKAARRICAGDCGHGGECSKASFCIILDQVNLDNRQIYFVNQIIEYIVCNGMMKDLSVLQEAPIVEVFTDRSLWAGIKQIIDQINANAAA